METLGTADPAFVQGMMPQLARVANQGQVREDDLNFMLSIMQGIAPRDEIEGLLAAQMAAVHNATMTLARRLNQSRISRSRTAPAVTAIPNWTGRLSVNGYPLAGLYALWLIGRVAIAGSAIWGAWLAAVIDFAFLLTIAAVAFTEIVAGKKCLAFGCAGRLRKEYGTNLMNAVSSIPS